MEDNCKEVGKDKYMCPLSGKKFRGPEFVRKHIHNKHAGAVQKVRDQVSSQLQFLVLFFCKFIFSALEYVVISDHTSCGCTVWS